MTASLTPDELRRLVGEHVTTVAPGETLVVQVGNDWTPQQVCEMQRAFSECRDFDVLVVPGTALGKIGPSDLDDAVRRVVREEMGAAEREMYPLREVTLPAGPPA